MDGCELPETVKVHIKEKEYVCSSSTNDESIRKDFVDCFINLDTHEASCALAIVDLSIKDNCFTSGTSVDDQ